MPCLRNVWWSAIFQQYQVVYMYIYMCTHQFLTLLRHKVHMKDSTRMKDIWCNCESERFLPISNNSDEASFLTDHRWAELPQLIQIYEATEWEREREETWSLFVSLILSKLDWGHHTINEPAVGKYKIGRLVSSTYFWSF